MKSSTRIYNFLLILILTSFSFLNAKSIYLIANHHTAQFDAWNLNPDGTATYQATYWLTHSMDPGGIAIDEDSKTLFITSEFDPGVELVDATTFQSLGVSSGPYDLAGIEVDQVNDIVYTVQRWTDDLYVYDWDPIGKTLTLKPGFPINLPNCSGAFGIALDETTGILWVSDTPNGIVRAYDINTWAEISSLNFSPIHKPVDICIDRRRQIIYTVSIIGGAWLPSGTGSTYISKFDLNTRTEIVQDMGHGGVGIAVDEVSGYVYVTGGTTSGDNLTVWNTFTSPFTKIMDSGPIGNPAGIVIPQEEVAYNPLHLAKNDNVNQCVAVGGQITYSLSFDNLLNNFPVTQVTLVDNLPNEVNFISATDGGIYDSGNHIVTWNMGTLAAGDPGTTVQLVVEVDPSTTPGITITNFATISSNETPSTTVTKETNICTAPIDNTPPSCELAAFYPGPPLAIDVLVSDDQSGVKTIEVSGLQNALVEIPKGSGNFYTLGDVVTFTTPQTSVLVYAEKINQSSSAFLALTSTDDAGNSTYCDPVYTVLSSAAPEGFKLQQNYPNPFNPTTTIHFSIAATDAGQVPVSLKVFDLSGREVKTLVNEPMSAGVYAVEWDGTNEHGEAVAGGVYIYRLEAGNFVATKKMVLIR